MSRQRDQRLTRVISDWFRAHARDLPWRCNDDQGKRDPYVALVSESMLQQTQVSRIIERLPVFLARFPTVEHLAAADEQEVLAAWSGLGYYRRAKNLRHAAQIIVKDHDGLAPDNIDALRTLPGVGRYTAGAISSMVYGQAQPAVDGNVERVLVRLDGRETDESPRARLAWAWERAAELVSVAHDPGALNEGLIELGALVCTPKSPTCRDCPLGRSCRARRAEIQCEIPRPKPRPVRSTVHHCAVLVTDRRGRRLIEQRPGRGLWSHMWQAPTLERAGRAASSQELATAMGASDLEPIDRFDHQTSHRLVRFHIWRAQWPKGTRPTRGRFALRREIEALPLASPHRRILLGS